MATIDWPSGQTYVNATAEGAVRLEHDHDEPTSADHDAVAARALAVSYRAVADALDAAADHVVATRLSATFAVLERAIAGRDLDHITQTAAAVRAMIDDVRDTPPAEHAAEPAVEQPAIT